MQGGRARQLGAHLGAIPRRVQPVLKHVVGVGALLATYAGARLQQQQRKGSRAAGLTALEGCREGTGVPCSHTVHTALQATATLHMRPCPVPLAFFMSGQAIPV